MLNTLLIKRDAGLAQQNGFGPAFYARLVEAGKKVHRGYNTCQRRV